MRQCSECGRRFEGKETVCPHDGTILDASGSFEEQAVGRTLDGKYRIDGFLKRGGMGAVYRGTHLMLSKAVAIKLIKPELVSSTDVVQRFLREARAAAKLSHQNIVTVHDLGQTADGTLYIVMELVDGASLKELIQKEGAFAPSRAIELVKGIARALALAHRNGIVHRDLKPQNIMVFREADGSEVPKLLDFGIAKTFEPMSPALTSTGMVLGTPHYMSTEQAKGLPADARSDLYALGVILYEMLVGRVPFDDASIPQILIKHLNEVPTPPTTINRGIPAGLERIVLRCLEKDPDVRYQSAEELLHALEPLADTAALGTPPLEPTVALAEDTVPTLPTRQTTMAGAVAAAPALASMPPILSPTGTVRAHELTPEKTRGGAVKWVALVLAVAAVALAALFFLQPRGRRDEAPETVVASEAPPPIEANAEPSPPVEAEPDEPSKSPPPPVAAAAPTPPIAQPAPTTTLPRTTTTVAPSPPPPTAPAVHRSPVLPQRPAVSVGCEGVRDGCAALRFAIVEACRKRGLRLARPLHSDVHLQLDVEEVEARREEQFGTTFVVRTYAVEVRGDSRHFDEELTLSPQMVTFDARLGREKLKEETRRIAADVVDAVGDYWERQRRR